MKKIVCSIPIPICCVALGFAGSGILLKSYHPLLPILCGSISFLVSLLVLSKLILVQNTIRDIFSDPVQSGAFAAFPMTGMFLSIYLSQWGAFTAGKILWMLAVLLHVTIILVFSLRYIRKFRIQNVHGTWFLVYIGIAASAIAAPAHNVQDLSLPLLYFAMSCLPCLLAVVSWRYLRYPEVSDGQKPLFCILAAPVSLCLCGYLQSAPAKSFCLVTAMLPFSVLLYIVAAGRLITLPHKTFYPGHAAFTFPFVISASAMKQSIVFLESRGCRFQLLPWVQTAETFAAVFLCVYVFVRFFWFIKQSCK